MIRPLVAPNSPVLTQVAVPIEEDENLTELMTDLGETCAALHRMCLAAPQIGISKRAIAFLPEPGMHPYILVNPELLPPISEWKDVQFENCASLPNYVFMKERLHDISLDACIHPGGVKLNLIYSAGIARRLQHALDHLNGIVLDGT